MVRELEQRTMKDICGDAGLSPESIPDDPGAGGVGMNDPPGAPEGDTAGFTTIDLVVGYDRAAREADGGRTQIEARIIGAVDRMNLSFANSLITQREVICWERWRIRPMSFRAIRRGTCWRKLVDLDGTSAASPELNTVSDYATALGADLRVFVVRKRMDRRGSPTVRADPRSRRATT